MATVSTPYGFKPVRMIGNRVVGGALPTNQYRIKQNYANVIPNGSPVVLTGATTYTSGNAVTVTYSGTTVTLTFTNAVSGLYPGMAVTVSGVTGATGANITANILTIDTTSKIFTYSVPSISGVVGGTAAVTGGAGYLSTPTDGGFNSLADKYIGIFVGCQYANAQNGQPQWDQWYPGSVNSANMVGYVVDDPDAVFQVQASALNFDAVGALTASYGFTTITAGMGTASPTVTTYAAGTAYNGTLTKDSNVVLDIATGTASTKPFKIVDISQTPDNANASGFVDVYVTAQKAAHFFTKAN